MRTKELKQRIRVTRRAPHGPRQLVAGCVSSPVVVVVAGLWLRALGRMAGSLLLWVCQGLLACCLVRQAAAVASQVLCTTNACYTVHLENTNNFTKAEEECKVNGGRLVTVKSQEEASHLQALLLQIPKSQREGGLKLWIGLHLEKRKCYQQHKALKGFSWVTDKQGEGVDDSPYSNWAKEPLATCTTKRCVTMNFDISSSHNFKWSDGKCLSNAQGHICKFSFRGMCRQVALAGPGEVEYETPFGYRSTSLNVAPFGTTATVHCSPQRTRDGTFLMCKENSDSVFDWSRPGAFCASPNQGCSYNNGGCEQECSLSAADNTTVCGCKDGYELMADRVTCAAKDHCRPNPCQHRCTNLPGHFKCTCSVGYVLAENNRNCTDVDECLQGPCDQVCTNTPGSFRCSCRVGFEAVGRACEDRDECWYDHPCAQTCINTNGSYACYCKEGYVKGEGGSTCDDVDECEKKPCDDVCYNTPGSYKCACGPGLGLAPDGISCIQEQFHIERVTSPNNKMDVMKSQHVGSESSPTPDEGRNDPKPVPGIVHNTGSVEATGASGSANTLQPPLTANVTGSMANMKDADTQSERILLFSVVACVVAMLLLMALALGVVMLRRRKPKKDNTTAPESATDKYSWEESNNTKAVGNEYR